MDIEKLHGTDPRLYQLVAPLVMSIPVLRYNNNYPFKTSVHHKWLVATEKGVVKGFMPIDIKSTGACIDNYYEFFLILITCTCLSPVAKTAGFY